MLQWCNAKVIDFPNDDYPDHVYNMKTYAFKVIAVTDALKRHPRILWIDAGLVALRPLDLVKRELETKGYFFVPYKNGMKSWEIYHPSLQEKFGISEIPSGQVYCIGGVQGWSMDNELSKSVLKLLRECALDLSCIMPENTNRQNFLQDQSVLNSIFAKLEVNPCQGNQDVFLFLQRTSELSSGLVSPDEPRALMKSFFRRSYLQFDAYGKKVDKKNGCID